MTYRFTIDVELPDDAPVTKLDRASDWIEQTVENLRISGFRVDDWEGQQVPQKAAQ